MDSFESNPELGTPSVGGASRPPAEVAPDTGRPFTSKHVLRFGVGFFFFSLLWIVGLMVVAAVLLPQRLRDIGVESPEALLGTISAVTAIVSLVSNLVFGNLSDRTRSRFGRRSPWVVSGAVLGGASLAAVGFLTSPILIIIVYSLCMVGLNMMLAPGVAVLADRVPIGRRGTISAFFGVGLTAGAPIGTLIGSRFIANPLAGFLLAGALMAVSGVIALAVWPREKSSTGLPPVASSLKDILLSFRPPRHAPDFYKAFVGRLFMLISYQMVMAYQLYIIQDHVGQTCWSRPRRSRRCRSSCSWSD